MSDISTPAGQTGGNSTASEIPSLADLPDKIRVHALAKLLDRSSRDVLDALTELGEDGRSAQSSVNRDVALKIAEMLVGAPDQPDEPEPAPPARPLTPPMPVFASASPVFLPPDPAKAQVKPPPREIVEDEEDQGAEDTADDDDAADEDGTRRRRRRGRRGRGRGKGGHDEDGAESTDEEPARAAAPERVEKQAGRKAKAEEATEGEDADAEESGSGETTSQRRRRRRRRRGGDDGAGGEDDPPNTVVHVREVRDEKTEAAEARDEVRSVRGSTRLEAKRQRRRDGREAGRRRAPILSEAEFLARRESVDRAMVIRERGDRTQIAVLEDGVLVEHFVTTAGSGSLVGNVYLGRVQNVLPSMEAAFVDIGRGRNAVLYAGEVDWDAAGLEGKARKIEQALSTGDSVLVQVTKDPVGHKGARLTTQISLPGRFLVYVPGGGATGISRKLPENERRRLKDVLKRVVPEDAGVIIRTASEGISEEELARDVRRLQAQWQVITDKTEGANGVKKANAPALLYEEPDLLIKVVRDLFTEDFSALVVEGETAWETVDPYVRHVAPELTGKVRKYTGSTDAFAEYRIDEQLLKALDRKVWLPSGGYLVIDRTEAMTVIDVNTGKFTGSGGNLEETVTRNNLESAEEIVRQLRLRDIGGIIVIDFIDMVLESNRDLVLRRLTECLGRDRTRHQVAEVTSLGLVQMTRKRVGTGLLEAFSTPCEHCKGRGVLVTTEPVTKAGGNGQSGNQQGGGRRSRGRSDEPAREAVASQAAKAAVRDIAKATRVSTPEPITEPDETTRTRSPEPAPEPATVSAQAAQVSTPETVIAPDETAEMSTPERAAASDQPAEVSTPEPATAPDQSAQVSAPERVAASGQPAEVSTPETATAPDHAAQVSTPEPETVPDETAQVSTPETATAPDEAAWVGTPDSDGTAGWGAPETAAVSDHVAPVGTPEVGAGSDQGAQVSTPETATAPDHAAQIGTPETVTNPDQAAQIGTPETTAASDRADLVGAPEAGAAPDRREEVGTPEAAAEPPDGPVGATAPEPDRAVWVSTPETVAAPGQGGQMTTPEPATSDRAEPIGSAEAATAPDRVGELDTPETAGELPDRAAAGVGVPEPVSEPDRSGPAGMTEPTPGPDQAIEASTPDTDANQGAPAGDTEAGQGAPAGLPESVAGPDEAARVGRPDTAAPDQASEVSVPAQAEPSEAGSVVAPAVEPEVVDVQPEAEPAREPEADNEAGPSVRRRRRAASRPAGPPMTA